MPIEFGCPQCLHLQKVDESKVGQQIYCPVCYFKLTVPAESTNKPIDESQLYTLDAEPWDIQDRQELISFSCDVCNTNIGVRKEQVGEEIVCAECGKKIIVPKSVAEKAEAKLNAKLDKILQSIDPTFHKETYSLRGGTTAPTDAVPTNPGSKQFRVPCRLCGTALFAMEEQVGTDLTCPDCDTKTKVPPQTIKIETALLPPTEFEGDTVFDTAAPTKKETQENLVPVICRLCGTRMYAAESQIGQFKTCPDCGRQTEIKAVPKHQMTKASTTSADAYGISKAGESAPRPRFRTLTDYRHVEGSLHKESPAERRVSSQSLNRPQLPKRPLTERFFVPFGYSSTWLSIVLFVAVIPLGAMIMSWAAGTGAGGDKLGSFGLAIFTLCFGVIICTVFIASFCYFATFLMHFYNIACSGIDEEEFKGEIAPSDYFVNGFWLFALSFVAILPGCFVGNFLYQLLESPFIPYVMIRISHWFFFPICFLSSMEEGSMFAVLAKNTIVSLFRRSSAWFRFYLLTGILFALSDLLFFFVAAWLDYVVPLYFLWITLFFFLFAVQSLFFFRLLGRHAWLLEETDRQQRELEDEEME